MTPDRERQLREQGRATFTQRGLSPRRRIGNFVQDIGTKAVRGLDMIGTGVDYALGSPGRLVTGFNENVPKGFSEQVGQATEATTGSRTLGAIAGFGAAIASPDPVGDFKAGKKAFEGFQDLSTKTLERGLKDKISVSRQYIADALNSADVKEAEKKVMMDVLEEYKGEKKIPVGEFAEKVKANLLPLKPIELSENFDDALGKSPRYSGVHLPAEQRGINYSERIYESPIKTSAGRQHFGNQSENYFGHVRTDDIVEPASGSFKSIEEAQEAGKKKGFTRRIIEVQSDLFQRGRLDNEREMYGYDFVPSRLMSVMTEQEKEAYTKAATLARSKTASADLVQKAREDTDFFEKKAKGKLEQNRRDDIDKLQPYRNTFWQRLIREEVKRAAEDGAKKIQVPAGETAMKVEGLSSGGADDWFLDDGYSEVAQANLVPGQRLGSQAYDNEFVVIRPEQQEGTFKAIPASLYDDIEDGMMEEFYSQGRDIPEVGSDEWLEFARDYGLESQWETYSIASEIDTNNPIYKFYEKDMGKYLKNKYNAELVQDNFGNQWWELNVPKEARKLPVEAFGVVGATGLGGAAYMNSQNQNDQRTLQ